MAKSWYLRQDGKSYGPIASSKLKELASQGRLTTETEVANDKAGPWHPISHLKGLNVATALNESHALEEFPPQASQIPAPPTVQPPPSQPVNIMVTASDHGGRRSNAAKPAEQTLWTGRPSHLTNLATYILCVLFSWLIVPIFVGLWRFLQLHCISYEVTTERIRETSGVLSKHIGELELYRVKDTTFSQTFVQRLFGLGTIDLSTSDRSSPGMRIQSINANDAMTLRESIRTFTERQRDRKHVREVDFT